MNFWRKAFPYAVIAAVTFLVFMNTLSFPVMEGWDDNVFVTEISDYLNFRPGSIIHLVTMPSLGNYIPLVNLSYALDYSVGGLDGFMYHFQNVLWHIVACVGLFNCIRLLGAPSAVSLAVTLLYAVHPQRTESVAWVSERRDVMCGAFYFWSAFFYLKFRDKKAFSLTAFILFLCACLSKPAAVTMPVTLAMYEVWKNRSILPVSKYLKLLPFFAVSLLVSAGTSILQLNPSSAVTIIEKLLTILHNFSWYALKNIYPDEMAPVYPKLVFDGSLILKISIFYILVAAVIFLVAIRSRKFCIYTVLPFLIAYSVSLLPTIGFVPIGIGVWDYADRYSYIPSAILAAGVALMLSSTAEKLSLRNPLYGKKIQQAGLLVMSAMILFLAWITFFYNYTWKSYSDLVEITVSNNPPNRNFLCLYAINMFAENKNDDPERCADYLLSVENKESFDHNGKSLYYTAMAVKAAVLYRKGNTTEALKLFNESFTHINVFVFQNPSPYTKLLETAAGCYLKSGKKKRALRCYDLIAANFEHGKENKALFHFYKGVSFYIRGNLSKAEMEFSEASVLAPDDRNIKANLDEVRKAQNQK
ncbi:MAG: hypothetical protein A2020_09680 [Lentisphaerae bacterium GWF2_45_14]|nr:MAG: hypothetical protein A2020_09680 [Lentisphaerae bacterium GWF2_45_14]